MPTLQVAPLVLSALVGLLIGLTTWGFVGARGRDVTFTWTKAHEDMLVGLLILAAFASGVFLAYVLLR